MASSICQNKRHLFNYIKSTCYRLNKYHFHSESNIFLQRSEVIKPLLFVNNSSVFCSNLTSHHNNNANKKLYCTNPTKDEPARKLPQLMEFPEVIWPSVIKTIRNWVLANLIIRPYFDNDFSLQDFVVGSKQALQVVSSKLAGGDINGLDGLVSADTIVLLQKSVSKMSMTQRQELAIQKEDIYFSFPYQIGVMFDDGAGVSQKRWVEITMCYHTLKGLKDMQEQGHTPPLNMGLLPEYRDKISICNYRFLKEYTKGVEGEWVVNVVNHFKPSDFISE